MVQETWVQSLVTSYQRLLKWYLIPPCLTLSNICYVSRVKLSYRRKGVAPSPTPRCSRYWKGSLLVALDYGRQLQLSKQKKIHLARSGIYGGCFIIPCFARNKLRKINEISYLRSFIALGFIKLGYFLHCLTHRLSVHYRIGCF